MIDLLIRARSLAFLSALAALVALLCWGRHVEYEQSIQSFFAADDPGVLDYTRAAEVFGSDNFVFVAYEDPSLFTPEGMDRQRALASALASDSIPGVRRVDSLEAMPVLWRLDDGLIALAKLPAFLRQPAVRALKQGLQGVEAAGEALTIGSAIRAADPVLRSSIQDRARQHPLFQGTLLDPTGRITALVVHLKSTVDHDLKTSVTAIRREADAFGARQKLGTMAVVGPPVLLADGFIAIEVDGRRLSYLGMGLIAIVMLVAVRSIWWAVVPMLAGWLVWSATETILSLLDLKLSLSGGPLVAQIIVLTMPAASHLAIHFRDRGRSTADRREAARGTLRAVGLPIAWCALAGALGYGALLTSGLVPIRQFGAILGVATFLAAFLAVALAPFAMLPPIRLELPVQTGSVSPVTQWMNRLMRLVCRHAGACVGVVLLVVIPTSILGLLRLEYEPNYINAFQPGSRVVRDYHWVERTMGGIGLVELVMPLDPTENTLPPATLAKLQSLDAALRAQTSNGQTASEQVVSLATVLDPDGRITALPPPQRAIALATKLELIAASPQADLLDRFWNKERAQTRVLLRILESQPSANKERAFSRAESAAQAAFGPQSYLTGMSYLMTQTVRAVTATQWSTLFVSALGVVFVLALALRNLRLPILALLPTALSISLVLGLMGWLGIKLDIATALVASVALGLSVDDTFHCLMQYRGQRRHHTFQRSVVLSYSVTGPGVLLSSLAVAVGFFALRSSEFVPFANFGVLIGIATGGSSIGNIVVLPAFLTLGERIRAWWTRRPFGAPLSWPEHHHPVDVETGNDALVASSEVGK